MKSHRKRVQQRLRRHHCFYVVILNASIYVVILNEVKDPCISSLLLPLPVLKSLPTFKASSLATASNNSGPTSARSEAKTQSNNPAKPQPEYASHAHA
jgi:hypothetical protein